MSQAPRDPDGTAGAGLVTRRLRAFLLFEAAAFVAAALVHSGVLVHGYQHADARTAESTIAFVLVVGLALTWVRPEWSRETSIAAQGFALLGTLVGILTIIVGVGPRTAPDVSYHIVIMTVLVWGVIVAVRAPSRAAPAKAAPVTRGVAAPRVTTVLAAALALGVLAQATFAGEFLSGQRVWLTWHENLGDFLLLVPLASLFVGLVSRRHQRDTTPILVSRVVLLAAVLTLVITGHAVDTSREMLAVHIPAAVATFGIVAYQALIAVRALAAQPGTRPSDRSTGRADWARRATGGTQRD
ncbi:MAG TPA: hypothetical protein VFA45_00305 [Actinomycetes bacterium]|jgi:hypothetical protein|nr:hypothetical protein [Actinomycetes bacterium]